MKRIAISGTGSVDQTYTSKFITLDYDVMVGTRNVFEKLEDTKNGWLSKPTLL